MPEQITNIFQYSEYNLFALSTYNPWLIIISLCIAILSSYMGFQIAHQAYNATPARKRISILIGSIALGGGVWSMHFIGMIALELCTDISYNLNITLLSFIPSLAASWVALTLITNDQIRLKQLIIGGILVGSGIGAMHYIGMAAMEMAPLLRYNLGIFVLSIVVAVLLAIIALWVSFGLEKSKKLQYNRNTKMAISSVVMGFAIAGMHYTGMAAARFVLPPGIELSGQSSDISLILAFGITTVTVVLIIIVLGTNLLFRYKDISTSATNNERRLLATMNTALDGIITIDAKGTIISINKAVSSLLCWSEDELIGQNVKMVVPGSDQQHHDQYISNYLTSRQAKIIGKGREVSVLTKHGEKIPVHLGIGHIELDDQSMFVAFISDLRQRKALEMTLREKETKIRSLISNIPGIAYRCYDQAPWSNLFISDEVVNMLGHPAEDFLGDAPKYHLSEFIHPEDKERVINTDLHNPDGYLLEFRMIDKHNKVKWVLSHGRALKIEHSDGYYLDGFIMDISDRKVMESALITAKETAEQAAATRAAFLANMSHEIRTPMNAIIGFSDILLDEALSSHQRKQISTINQSARSLLHILNDVLDSAKLDKGKFQLEYRDFYLVEEVDSVVSTLWLQAQRKGLLLELQIDEQVQQYFHGVPDRIRQVLTNIIGNAIKFTEQGGVTIKINSPQPDTLHFAVIDTGMGMTDTQLQAVFEAFSQADASMSRRFGGTGLGTTISKQLVELMGGTITAKSELNKGSTFEFTVPIKKAKQSNASKKQELHIDLPQLSVLIVDDIEQNIDLLKLVLKRNKHVVSVAINGEQALLKMKSEQFDLVLMDVQMPVMDGLTAAKLRRQYEQENGLPRLPIIALTAGVLPQDKRSALDSGMDGFTNKPINVPQLLKEITRVLTGGKTQLVESTPISEKHLRVDLDKGVQLWGSKTSLFNEVTRFLEQSKETIDTLPELVKSHQWTALEEAAHKYKGVTGNLALNRLMEAFKGLEEVSHKQVEEKALHFLDQIIEELEAITVCADRMSSVTHKAIEISPKTPSYAALIDLLLKLKISVENNEFDDQLLDSLEELQSNRENEINAIITACNDFEFEVALNHIEDLIKSIQSLN
ncbi:ATP-binding protein [Psychromonas sp. 14N.309.X.WAT.B.A12]|uniref:MHYT domain-containing protein n=1 Tax=Psychromonas sp. 14N.309.X.WAT.B.A12 TaxID=2998322 RepID=UPI0025B1AC9E|nr:MHYT domain-containing protein [Psychromonas sp. 14N.309.X.WAT.B.A12]MDN2664533.1 ATP-binding protein [Psychromonas sp. 14N.309.X.WAT.B.A12]